VKRSQFVPTLVLAQPVWDWDHKGFELL
jgi:hypothetical protein